jgi:uncharacterized membrane protein YjjP (DUF1212 family)
MLDDADVKKKVLYPMHVQLVFRFLASCGACAFWFNGSWIDTVVAGFCGLLVGVISGWSFLSKDNRVVFESIASISVGFISGLLSCLLPTKTCFVVAMGISGVLNVLQGFRVVYSGSHGEAFCCRWCRLSGGFTFTRY